jgi:uncharacterized protein (DUF362 family)
MDRRSFLKNSVGVSMLAGLSHPLTSAEKVRTLSSTLAPDPFDLVAVKGGEPDTMFARGIDALGGIQSFVKKGQTVVVKPNIGWDVSPERAGNTNPKLIEEIVSQCYQAGAKEVYAFDNTCDNWERCYATSGIARAVKNANGKMVPGNTEGYFQSVPINGESLREAKVHELILESDVVINVPILKNHGGARLTMAMKNLMGVVWDRRYWHRNDLHQCIADFAAFYKPQLNVIDAYYVMKENGPRGVSLDDVVTMRSLLISSDMVAIDTAGTSLFGLQPTDIRYLGIAEKLGVGTSDLKSLNIKRISLS